MKDVPTAFILKHVCGLRITDISVERNCESTHALYKFNAPCSIGHNDTSTVQWFIRAICRWNLLKKGRPHDRTYCFHRHEILHGECGVKSLLRSLLSTPGLCLLHGRGSVAALPILISLNTLQWRTFVDR